MTRRDPSDQPALGMFSLSAGFHDVATTPGGGPFAQVQEPAGWEARFDAVIEEEEATSLFFKEDMPWNEPMVAEDIRDDEAMRRARAATLAAEEAAQREAMEAAQEYLAVEAVVAEVSAPMDASMGAALFVPERPDDTSGEFDSVRLQAPIVIEEPSIQLHVSELHGAQMSAEHSFTDDGIPNLSPHGRPELSLAEGTPNPELDRSSDLPWFVRTNQPLDTIPESGPTVKKRAARGSAPQGFPLLPQTIMTIPPQAVAPQVVGSVEEMSAEQLDCRKPGLFGWVKKRLKK